MIAQITNSVGSCLGWGDKMWFDVMLRKREEIEGACNEVLKEMGEEKIEQKHKII